jgi:replicative DNA helicase
MAEGREPSSVVAAAMNDFATYAAGLTGAQAIQVVGEGEFDLTGQRAAGIRPTFLPKLSDLTQGFRPSTLTTISGRTGAGKSSLLQAIAIDAAVVQNLPVLILDSEMTRPEVLSRAVSNIAQLDETAIQGGRYADDERSRVRIEDALSRIRSAPLHHVRTACMEADQVIGVIRQFKRCMIDTQPARRGLIIVDYLKVVASSRVPEFVLLGELTSRLKDVANELEVPIVAGVQSNRAALKMGQAEYASEAIGVLGGSDRIAHNCDCVIVLRDLSEDERAKVVEEFGIREHAGPNPLNAPRFNQVLHLAKQRGGSSCQQGIPLYFKRGQTRYEEMAHQLDDGGGVVRDGNGWIVDSAEIKLLHSPAFTRRRSAGKTLSLGLRRSVLPKDGSMQAKVDAA